MIKAPEVFCRAVGHKPHDGEYNYCGLCGNYARSKHWKDTLKPSFTAQAELKSPYVCWACECVANDRRSRSNILVKNVSRETGVGEYSKPQRKEVWPLLFSPPAPPFLLYLTMSGKKHGLWRQHIAMNKDGFRVQCEDLSCVYLDNDKIWMMNVANMVLNGCSRKSIMSGMYPSRDILSVGVERIRDIEPHLNMIRGSYKWLIMLGVMPGKDDLKDAIANVKVS